jgi:molecular chaperone GrpE
MDEKELEKEVNECPNEANVETNAEHEEEKHSKKEIKNKLKEENRLLKERIYELENELLRNRADLENFKKRQREEAIKDRIYANSNLIQDFLAPLEFLDKACNFETESVELKNFLIGFQMIDKQFYQVLENDGLKEIVVKIGDEFNPNFHHALETVETEDYEANKIVEVLSKGYTYKERIIKPVMVKVSK